MTPLTLTLLLTGAILAAAWGLRSLLERSEAALGDLLAWPTATRAPLSEERR